MVEEEEEDGVRTGDSDHSSVASSNISVTFVQVLLFLGLRYNYIHFSLNKSVQTDR
jgi:hypothetical protein